MIVQISNQKKEEIFNWLKDALPKEACGLLAGVREGDAVTVKKFYGMHNMDENSSHFAMDAREQFAVVKEIREKGWILLASVHSHPDTKAEPSEEDKRLAYDGGIFYLICSFMEGEPVMKAYRIIDRKRVTHVDLRYI